MYEYAGSSNIYQNAVVPPAPASFTTGPVFERRKETERSVFAQDIVSLSQKIKLHAGLRQVQVKRTEFEVVPSDTSFTLPNVALVYNPTQDWTVYGSMAHGLEHGGVAPIETTNANRALDPSRSKQVEFGVKGAMNRDMTVSAALFQVTKGLEFTANPDGTSTYVRAGEAQHRGLELGMHGKATRSLQYSVSLAALDTEQSGTGQASMDGKRVTNVPKFKSTTWVEYSRAGCRGPEGQWRVAVRGTQGLRRRQPHLRAGVSHPRPGRGLRDPRDGREGHAARGRHNVTDKFYWRDVTPALGGYLLPGAPRTFRMSAQFDF